jgi:pilin
MSWRTMVAGFVVVVAGVFVGMLLFSAYRSKRPVDDFGVGEIHERIRMIKADFVRAADPAKTAVSEYYVNSGTWPATNKDAALPEPAMYRGESLRTLVLAGNKITMTFDDKIGPDGGQIILVGEYVPDSNMGVKWSCISPNIADISAAIPYCRYAQ